MIFDGEFDVDWLASDLGPHQKYITPSEKLTYDKETGDVIRPNKYRRLDGELGVLYE